MPRYTSAYSLFLVLWFGQLFIALLPSWSGGSYYDYGFIAPFALGFIFVTRWNEAGLPAEDVEQKLVKLGKAPLTWFILVPAIALLLPLRLIETVEPNWRGPLYLHAFICLAFTAYCQLRLFGFKAILSFIPFAGLLVLAIPLPSLVETSLISDLTGRVTEVAAYSARWAGIPVTIAGDSLLLENIPLHVAEGCSGIRSFQSSVFVSFLLGELLRLKLPQRLVLLGSGVIIAFASNCIRVSYLVRYADKHGGENLNQLHDDTGVISLIVTFAALFLVGFLLRPRPAVSN
ncbi:MAG: exosortase/archaeosortase family protein [Verrucomicrobiales bacterium]|nr:exosortase/archaeosortase family protein [Verrucomicrobiales bacterium]